MGNQREPTTPEQQFGLRLRLLREQRGWSQQFLADQVATWTGSPHHFTAVSKTEAGIRTVRLNEAVTIAAVFGTTVDAMVSADVDPVAAALQRVEDNITETRQQLAELGELRDRLVNRLTERGDEHHG